MNEFIYWIWLSLCCTPDTTTFAKLIAVYETASEIYEASEKDIRSCVGANNSDCSKLLEKDLSEAQKIFEFCRKKEVGILTYDHPAFPPLLRKIPTPPVLLYYRGPVPDFRRKFCCSVVGTRLLSDYGRKNAFLMGVDMACAGSIIVSGMAFGIDGVAMAGALSAGGTVVAVLGCGIDICYPKQHLTLAREIVKQGCILSEYPPGTKPNKYNFPRRNRLISGISNATVVVEGKETSGSLITARHALKQNRSVYAFPGNVTDSGSQVTSLLLKNGAKICTAADDIIRDFEKEYNGRLNPFKLRDPSKSVPMFDFLRKYEVGCVTPTDDIFSPARTKKEIAQEPEDPISVISYETETPEPDENSFDAAALKLYKKIPVGKVCDIESLADEEFDLRSISTLLLKLELGRFVKILPGERVRRN